MKTRTANASILMHTVRALRPQLQMRALKKNIGARHKCPCARIKFCLQPLIRPFLLHFQMKQKFAQEHAFANEQGQMKRNDRKSAKL